MVKSHRGLSRIGCLFTILVIATIGYFGYNIGAVFLANYEFEDRMRQEAHFAVHRSDAVIRVLWGEYYRHIELPGMVREIHFSPSATGIS